MTTFDREHMIFPATSPTGKFQGLAFQVAEPPFLELQRLSGTTLGDLGYTNNKEIDLPACSVLLPKNMESYQ